MEKFIFYLVGQLERIDDSFPNIFQIKKCLLARDIDETPEKK